MAYPGEIVEQEVYEAQPTGAPYSLTVRKKRHGGYVAVSEQLDGPRPWQMWTGMGRQHTGFKTVAGAMRAARRLADDMEDLTFRHGFDD